MSHSTDLSTSVIDALREAILCKLPGSDVEVRGGNGHFTIEVTCSSFSGKSRLESQRIVYAAIAHLMQGAQAPVHAVDSMKTRTPA